MNTFCCPLTCIRPVKRSLVSWSSVLDVLKPAKDGEYNSVVRSMSTTWAKVCATKTGLFSWVAIKILITWGINNEGKAENKGEEEKAEEYQ